MAITILDVVAAAMVSKTTASDILRGAHRPYNAQTVQRVQEIAEELGYQASGAARLLRQNSSNIIIGIAVGVRQRPYLNSLVVAIHADCIKRGYQPAIFEPSHLLPQQGHSPFPSPDMLAGIFSADLSLDNDIPNFYARLRDRLPIVALYNIESCSIDCVAPDWATGVELATQHLVNLGHRHIAYAHDPKSKYYTDRIRIKNWEQCIHQFNLVDTDEYQITYCTPKLQATSGERLVNAPSAVPYFVEQVVARLTQMQNPPSALICTSDELAMALIAKLTEKGWKLPNDLSIVGFYGMEFGECCYPSLTTIAQPLEKISTIAMDRLAECIEATKQEKDIKPKRQLLIPEIHVRQSTMKAR
ncbi:MAG: LacI family DNA-binding transcriptional regulator [Abditibacteriaceae bacterium]